MTSVRRRAFLATGVMAGCAGLSAVALRPPPPVPPSTRLDELLPSSFGSWRIDPVSRAFVRGSDLQGKLVSFYDDLLERTFVDDAGYRIMLSIAYVAQAFDDGSTLQVHLPEICYRVSGYRLGETARSSLALPDRAVPVMQLEASLPGRHEPLTYWVVVGGAVVNDHGRMRKQRMLAALRREPLDSMLVRVSSIDQDAARAYRKQFEFSASLAEAMPVTKRARIFGKA
jgi:EpsI family protein